jgi:hypothetical protein
MPAKSANGATTAAKDRRKADTPPSVSRLPRGVKTSLSR